MDPPSIHDIHAAVLDLKVPVVIIPPILMIGSGVDGVAEPEWYTADLNHTFSLFSFTPRPGSGISFPDPGSPLRAVVGCLKFFEIYGYKKGDS